MSPTDSSPTAATTGLSFVDPPPAPVDLTAVPLHLGPGGTIRSVPDFDWSRIAEYSAQTEADGPDGRMVTMFEMDGSWDHWEQHPIGAETVICCSGRHRFTQEIDGTEVVIELAAGQALVNPPGVWHTNDTIEKGWVVGITSGLGTTHRPR